MVFTKNWCVHKKQKQPLEKEFLEISQNSQKNTCVRVSFLIKLQAQACDFIKIETLSHRCFPVNFEKFSKNTVFAERVWATASEKIGESIIFVSYAGIIFVIKG